MGERKTRRKFTAEQKAAVLQRHLKDKVPVSDLCDEYKIQPSVFYGWQRQVLENMATALEPNGRGRSRDNREGRLESKIEALEAKLAKKDNVIAEISEEYVQLKKELGEL
jgi:transposase-like protein